MPQKKKKNKFKLCLSKQKGPVFSRFWLFFLAVVIILSQSYVFSAFEAYVVNVTAQICHYSETRTIGYWKTHPHIYDPYYLPQVLGPELIETVEQATAVFEGANAQEMRYMLKAQLLGMKFNLVHFGIGGYLVESEGKTIDELILEADQLLIEQPEPARPVLEAMKDILDYLNNLHQLAYCSDNGWQPFLAAYRAGDNCLKINEVYYLPDENHGLDNDEWIELYNACSYGLDLSGWSFEDNVQKEVILGDYFLQPQQFVLILPASSTLGFWPEVPGSTLKIIFGKQKLFNGLGNNGDFLFLRDYLENTVDVIAWGNGINAFTPPVSLIKEEGSSLGRLPDGLDTDTASDWLELFCPSPGKGNGASPCLAGPVALSAGPLLTSGPFLPENNSSSTASETASTSTDSADNTTSTDNTFFSFLGSVVDLLLGSQGSTSSDEAPTSTEDVLPEHPEENTTSTEPVSATSTLPIIPEPTFPENPATTTESAATTTLPIS